MTTTTPVTGGPPPAPVTTLMPAPTPAHQIIGAGWALVRAAGELDIATAPALETELDAAVTGLAAEQHLVLDLADVTFLDCSGILPLLAARQRLGDRFWLARPSEQARRLLTLTGLTGAFSVLDEPPPLSSVPHRRTAQAASRGGDDA